jgi:hypothetical protein
MRLLGQAPVRDGDAVVYRVPQPAGARTTGWLLSGISAVPSGLAVTGIVIGQPALFWGLLLVTGLSVSSTVFFVRQVLLPPVLTTSQLLLPGAFSGWQALELATVAGVGLRFVSPSSAKPSRWTLMIWRDDGTRRTLLTGPQIGRVPGAAANGLPVTEEERDRAWRLLAGTQHGQTATRIAEQALAVQGPDGVLARRRLERIAAPSADELAYWSPDGGIGPLP